MIFCPINKYAEKVPNKDQHSLQAIHEASVVLQKIETKKKELAAVDDTFKGRIQDEIDGLQKEANDILDKDLEEKIDKTENNPNLATENSDEQQTDIFEQVPQGDLQSGDEVHSQMQDIQNRLEQRVAEAEKKLGRPLTQHEREDVEKQAAFDYDFQNHQNRTANLRQPQSRR